MCDFCNIQIYENISEDEDWEIVYADGYIDVRRNCDLGNFGEFSVHTEFKINYCPICGRKLSEE